MSIGKVSYDTHALREGGVLFRRRAPSCDTWKHYSLFQKNEGGGCKFPDFTLSNQTRGSRTVAAAVSS